MCGICGIISQRNGQRVTDDALKAMCDIMQHRGPDADGMYVQRQDSAYVGIGHRRLKIIDLSNAGAQPMKNEDASIWLVFNGEIYNYKDLRPELEKKGHLFTSNTDTETIIHLYEEYQEDCVNYLRGMFAFAIWDEKRKVIFLARDRVGKKPLLYSYADGVFCFASEFAPLLASGLVKKDINYDSLNYYLTFGYVPAPLTIYKNVYKLQPAHWLVLKDGDIHINRYWQLDYSKKLRISVEEAGERLISLMEEAVKIRLYSDVALGAFLSGGIDSSTVVALMSRVSSERVKTFSIGFHEEKYSEFKYARAISEIFDTDHTEFMIKPNMVEILPLLVERYGEPYADSSCIPTYYVSQQARRFVTVALNGDGGDELFGGYERYQMMLVSEIYQKIPSFLRKVVSGILDASFNSQDSVNALQKVKRMVNAFNLAFPARYLRWVSAFSEDLKNDLYSVDFKNKINRNYPADYLLPYFNMSDKLALTDRLLMADTNTYLPEDLLVKVDIASMANSLEVRSPFLDHKVMEFAASLPAEYKIKNLITKKYILKKALKNILPREILDRRKMGFSMPVGRWLKGELNGLLRETLLSKASLGRGYFRPDALKHIIKQHTAGKRNYGFELWALLLLELWHEKFID